MAGSAGRKAIRVVVVVLGAVLILAVGVYGPATLVGPLPTAEASTVDPSAEVAPAGLPTMPTEGASAVIGADSTAPLAAAGLTEAVPLGGTVKVITALVVLDAKPLAAGDQGPAITISREDYDGFLGYITESSRAVPMITGEQWSQRDVLTAMLLGSSNAHSDVLARWAFGSIDGYLAAAQSWLTEKGLSSVQLVDATGLDEGDVGTASDLARISALAFADPAIAELMALPDATVSGNRRVQNLAVHAADLGMRGLSLSYTDQAGLCFLFALDVTPADGDQVTLYGAFLREPDWDTLDADLEALSTSATATLTKTAIVTKGQTFAVYTTPWGETAHAVAMGTESRMLWTTAPLTYTVDVQPLTSGSAGQQVGTVSVDTPDGTITVLLQLDARLAEPGPLWRLTHPIPMISTFLDSRFS
ncbi:D-alanyl-D-alanine carboxypeptidase family protein [Cnuibacter sp. UC19_7]|uniref:D-alanyl-D-alanine carboxypeptidase family protein n=1 Tax=Cnuibacter sp. UC19_7 TaxID=3350166 RepID=UPI00366D7C8F